MEKQKVQVDWLDNMAFEAEVNGHKIILDSDSAVGGEDRGPRPDEDGLTPETWCDYTHMNNCVAGIQKEWWYHRDGCSSWFTIYRDTRINLEVSE